MTYVPPFAKLEDEPDETYWRHPDQRLPLSKCFGRAISRLCDDGSYQKIYDAVVRAHRLENSSDGVPETAYVVWPHKQMRSSFMSPAEWVPKAMNRRFPDINWVYLESLCEIEDLDRGALQKEYSLGEFFRQQQKYLVDWSSSEELNCVLTARSSHKPVFFIVDDVLQTGATACDISSLITFNGGVVAGMYAGEFWGSSHLRQQDSDLYFHFKDAGFNTGRIPDVAACFGRAVPGLVDEYGHEAVLTHFDTALSLHGLSLGVLANGEYDYLIRALDKRKENWSMLLHDLGYSMNL